MKAHPSTPSVENAPTELFESGHLWIREQVDGGRLRFRVTETGRIVFGDDDRVYERENPPEPYRHAVRYVRETLDRGALRDGTTDPSAFVFFGRATYRRRIDYDWDRLPPFLGYDVWSTDEERVLPPDVTEQAYDRLGLQAVNAFDRERPARQFSLQTYETPDSAWHDGPALGVVFQNKRGLRAAWSNPEVGDCSVSIDADAETLADRWASDERIESLVDELGDRNQTRDHERVRTRLYERLVRERYAQLYHGSPPIDRRAFRERLDERVTEWFADANR